jgi:hypothetical protein
VSAGGLSIGMPQWPAQYKRMMRWHDRIAATVGERGRVDEHHLDDLYAFFVMCHHLNDWLQNDRTVTIPKKDIRAFIKRERSLRICADLANGVKHFVRDRPAEVDPRAFVTLGGSVEDGKFEASAVIFIGELMEAWPIVRECVDAWDRFLCERSLLPLSGDEEPN